MITAIRTSSNPEEREISSSRNIGKVGKAGLALSLSGLLLAGLANDSSADVVAPPGLPGPWGALSEGVASASAGGVFEAWLLANSFEHQAGFSEATMVTREQMNLTTSLVSVGGGLATISFGPGAGIFFTGLNLAPGHPPGPDFVQIGGGGGAGFSVPVDIVSAVPDDSYDVAMTATAATHGGSMTDSNADSGGPVASTDAFAVFGPTEGGAPATPHTTFKYCASSTVRENGGPTMSLLSGCFFYDDLGDLSTTGDINPADISFDGSSLSFAALIDFSAELTDPIDSFVFNFESMGDLKTVAVPEPGSIFLLFGGLAMLYFSRRGYTGFRISPLLFEALTTG